MTVDAVERQLQTTVAGGLSSEEVSLRRARHGPNSIREAKLKSPWRIFAGQFADFMIAILLAAAVIAGFLGEPADTVAIVAIVVLNAAIGFVQEYRAEHAMAALRKMAAHQARALRNGEPATVPAADLVPGDIVLLRKPRSCASAKPRSPANPSQPRSIRARWIRTRGQRSATAPAWRTKGPWSTTAAAAGSS
jgi:Ca2+-transporting ATPase